MSLNSGSLRNSQTPRMRMNSITSTTTSVLVKTTKETLQDGSTRSITRQTIQDLGDYEIVQTTRIIPKHVVTASDNDLEALIGDFDQDFHNEIDYIPEEDEAVEENQGNSNDTSSGYYSVYSDAEEAPTRVIPRSNVPSPRQPIEHSDSITSSNLRKNVKFHAPPQQPKKEMKPKKSVQLTDEEMYSKAMEVAMAKVYGDRLNSMNKRGDATNPAVTATPSLTEQSIDGKHASKEQIKIEADAQASRVQEKKGEPASNGKSDGKFDNSHSDASTGPTTPPASTTPSPASAQRKFFKMGSSSETKRHSSTKSKHPSPQKSQLMRRLLALFDLA
ncbi:GQ67_03309T0 [Komagataella phaffii]|nr:GQ67_03309T0 [Komagataella phaffii]AOA68562.1 GQ68_03278T0 [Komagataella phaffii GS115]